ncbi:hypothetical protein HAX54_041116 [Datura stramonium]|uniref:Uncharacterized protein n=1 Tax=Datura stramonium TaxID=4076 RepID=A0ABS8RNJ6_DATST|nr:hypothetical protein [Datura stramonium]
MVEGHIYNEAISELRIDPLIEETVANKIHSIHMQICNTEGKNNLGQIEKTPIEGIIEKIQYEDLCSNDRVIITSKSNENLGVETGTIIDMQGVEDGEEVWKVDEAIPLNMKIQDKEVVPLFCIQENNLFENRGEEIQYKPLDLKRTGGFSESLY